MDADEFVRRLNHVAPTEEELLADGVPPTIVAEFISPYFPQLQEHRDRSHDPLIDLVTRYRFTGQIGIIQLGHDAVVQPLGTQIGTFEVDLLVIRQESAEVAVVEFGTDGHVLWRCGKDGDRFLDAMCVAAESLARIAYDPVYREDVGAKTANAALCADLAGGQHYGDFYRTLLMAWDD